MPRSVELDAEGAALGRVIVAFARHLGLVARGATLRDVATIDVGLGATPYALRNAARRLHNRNRIGGAQQARWDARCLLTGAVVGHLGDLAVPCPRAVALNVLAELLRGRPREVVRAS